MRRWLGGIAAFLLYAGSAAGAPADCGAAPDVKCLAAEIFALAKTLPADDFFRRHVAFAEQELAPGDVATALEYIVADNPDPPPWEDVDWIAKAGRFDLAIKQARQLKSPAQRVGGLLAVAGRMLDRNDAVRAQKIVEEAERQLPSVSGDDPAYADLFAYGRGDLWLRLGKTDRAVRSIAGSGTEAVSTLLGLAGKYPAAAVRLREQAWREAERGGRPYAWQLLVEDAIKRGDQAEAARAGERASSMIGSGHADTAIALARALSTAGLPDLAARLVKPWPQWIQDDDAIRRLNTVTDIAEKLDADALALAMSSPTGDPKLQWDHDAALHNLALARAGRGDIQGAFVAAAKLRGEAKLRDVMSYIVRRAIDSDHTPVVGPAIEALQELAIAAQDAGLLLQAADRWYAVGSENKARNSFAQAMKLVDAGQATLTGEETGLAAELMWRLNRAGKPEALIGIVDRMGVKDPGAIDHLVEIARPVSPAVAVQLTDRQAEVERRIDELGRIAIQIAASAK
jgi:hypothetical protein